MSDADSEFLDFIAHGCAVLSEQAVASGEPFLGYLLRMAADEARQTLSNRKLSLEATVLPKRTVRRSSNSA